MKNRQRAGLSPYRRHNKQPCAYSAEVRGCIRACKEGRGDDYRDETAAFMRRYPDMARVAGEVAKRRARWARADHENVIDYHENVIAEAA